MRAQAFNKYRPNEISDAALAASRQVWLAGLGAAAVGREWIQTEAGNTFRALVKEGSAVETRAVRMIGKRVESSVVLANVLWRETRHNVQSTVRQVADNAVLFVKQALPRNLPVIAAAGKPPAGRKSATAKRTPAKRTAHGKTVVKARRSRAAKRVAR